MILGVSIQWILIIAVAIIFVAYKIKDRKREDEFHEQNDDFE